MDDVQNNLKDDFQKANQLLQNAQAGPSSGRVPPPISTSSTQVPSLTTSSTTAAAAAALNMPPRGLRRVPMPMQYHMSSATGAGFGGAYNNYPFNRPYMNMGGYNTYSSYGQPMPNQFQNPVIIAAAENSRPAFESIQSVVQSFNAVSMMLDSTLTAMQMSFHALLGVAENFTRLRSFMMKLYSTIVSFRLARWFLTKLFYLLRLVRGDRGSTAEEDLWTSLSATAPAESFSSDNRSWPLVVFTGLLVTTPYLMYKLLSSITPVSSPLSTFDANTVMPTSGAATTSRSALNVAFKAHNDWSSLNSTTIPLVKGQTYFTSKARIALCTQNGGWLLVDDSYGRQGHVPLSAVKARKINKPLLQPVETEIFNDVSTMVPPIVPSMVPPMIQQMNPFIVPSTIPEQTTQPPLMPITEVHENPIVLTHPLNDSKK